MKNKTATSMTPSADVPFDPTSNESKDLQEAFEGSSPAESHDNQLADDADESAVEGTAADESRSGESDKNSDNATGGNDNNSVIDDDDDKEEDEDDEDDEDEQFEGAGAE
jgi:hypothetical protein